LGKGGWGEFEERGQAAKKEKSYRRRSKKRRRSERIVDRKDRREKGTLFNSITEKKGQAGFGKNAQ